MNVKYFSFTNEGLQRKVNEDSIYAFEKDKCAVFIVADGMGGYENGKTASDTIVKYVAKYIELDMEKIVDAKKQFDKVYDSNTFYEDLKNCLLNANKDIFENFTAKGHNSGSTLIMMALYEDNTLFHFWRTELWHQSIKLRTVDKLGNISEPSDWIQFHIVEPTAGGGSSGGGSSGGGSGGGSSGGGSSGGGSSKPKPRPLCPNGKKPWYKNGILCCGNECTV